MDNDLKPEHVQWCRSMFASLAEGGQWGIPRSGLIFTKRHGELVLTEQMPWQEGMDFTPAELAEQQDAEFETNREHFAAAGVTVSKALSPTFGVGADAAEHYRPGDPEVTA